jgi:hypothetical protein
MEKQYIPVQSKNTEIQQTMKEILHDSCYQFYLLKFGHDNDFSKILDNIIQENIDDIYMKRSGDLQWIAWSLSQLFCEKVNSMLSERNVTRPRKKQKKLQ